MKLRVKAMANRLRKYLPMAGQRLVATILVLAEAGRNTSTATENCPDIY
jgi:hypothetical protein